MYPSYSYLSPATIGMALDLARELHGAAEEVRLLVSGETAAIFMGVSGRAGDRVVAIRDWIGPHRDTFDRLMENEFDSARVTTERLIEEAEAWARFWAMAINARNDRLHDEAMTTFDRNQTAYEDRLADYQETIAIDPAAAAHVYPPTAPRAPTRPPPVSVPSAANDYRPTG
ncbi:MAG: hypothetical protein AAF547_07455 [Actinomycetota bacterium]